jgi:hypothetical protein
MRACVATCAALALATPLQALSCLPADPLATFTAMTDENEPFILLSGQLDFDPADLPAFIEDDPTPDPAPIAATFTGAELTADGLGEPVTIPASLQITCAGPWCGSASAGQDAVIFASGDLQAVTIYAGPCGGQVFYDPTPQDITALTTCLQNGPCSPQQLQ